LLEGYVWLLRASSRRMSRLSLAVNENSPASIKLRRRAVRVFMRLDGLGECEFVVFRASVF
jgi:hypothetical protein